jgi:hypothetical protein
MPGRGAPPQNTYNNQQSKREHKAQRAANLASGFTLEMHSRALQWDQIGIMQGVSDSPA